VYTPGFYMLFSRRLGIRTNNFDLTRIELKYGLAYPFLLLKNAFDETSFYLISLKLVLIEIIEIKKEIVKKTLIIVFIVAL